MTKQDEWLSEFRERRDALLSVLHLNSSRAPFVISNFQTHNRARAMIADGCLLVEALVIESKERDRANPKGVEHITRSLRALLTDIEGGS